MHRSTRRRAKQSRRSRTRKHQRAVKQRGG